MDQDTEIRRLRHLLQGATEERDKWFGIACDEQVSNQWREKQITEARAEIEQKHTEIERRVRFSNDCARLIRERDAELARLRSAPAARVIEAALLYPSADMVKEAMEATGMPENFLSNPYVIGEMTAAIQAVGKFIERVNHAKPEPATAGGRRMSNTAIDRAHDLHKQIAHQHELSGYWINAVADAITHAEDRGYRQGIAEAAAECAAGPPEHMDAKSDG